MLKSSPWDTPLQLRMPAVSLEAKATQNKHMTRIKRWHGVVNSHSFSRYSRKEVDFGTAYRQPLPRNFPAKLFEALLSSPSLPRKTLTRRNNHIAITAPRRSHRTHDVNVHHSQPLGFTWVAPMLHNYPLIGPSGRTQSLQSRFRSTCPFEQCSSRAMEVSKCLEKSRALPLRSDR